MGRLRFAEVARPVRGWGNGTLLWLSQPLFPQCCRKGHNGAMTIGLLLPADGLGVPETVL